MRVVKIGELKSRLSAHLKRVRQGEEVLVCDRNQPIARIVPCDASDYSADERNLIARGIMTPPRKTRPKGPWPRPPGNIPDEVIEEVWRQEREGR